MVSISGKSTSMASRLLIESGSLTPPGTIQAG